MNRPLILEVTRIALRYIGAYLITIGAAPELLTAATDPDVVKLLAGFICSALAEAGWLKAKLNQKKAV